MELIENKELAVSIPSRRFCVAPMLDWTDRHCRFFYRLMSAHAYLYSEMITTGALLHGDNKRFLQFNKEELPLALQLGGSNPLDLAVCSKMAEDFGYSEVNLNVGCPSDRVQNGRFGACLMGEPELVAECVAQMINAVSIPVTVKCRIGIDERDSYDELLHFVDTVASAGCNTFIIHARKAWLSGLSPKQNRDVPPLRYDVVYAVKKDLPRLEIIINGGITTLDQAVAMLTHVDGVMLGREVYQNPYLLTSVDRHFYGVNKTSLSREQILQLLIPYIQQQLATGLRLNTISRHILGLFQGCYGGRMFRRYLSENACKFSSNEQVINDALKLTVRELGVANSE